MKLDIYNLTDRSLLCQWNFKSPQEHHILLPSQPTSIKTPKRSSTMTLTAHQSMSQRGQKDEIWLSTTSFSFKRRSRASWVVMEVDESSPWTIYRSRVSCSSHFARQQSQNDVPQVSRRHQKLLILPKRDPLSFLSGLSDFAPLSSLCLPGESNSPVQLAMPRLTLLQERTIRRPPLSSSVSCLTLRIASLCMAGLLHSANPSEVPSATSYSLEFES